jgi:hypothetical protein
MYLNKADNHVGFNELFILWAAVCILYILKLLGQSSENIKINIELRNAEIEKRPRDRKLKR